MDDDDLDVSPSHIVTDPSTSIVDRAEYTKEALHALRELLQKDTQTYTKVLNILFQLKGHPYDLQYHFPFEPMFRKRRPKKEIWLTARQVGKSQQIAARMIIMALTQPYYPILVISPLFEQIRRLSQNYVRPLIEGSPLRYAIAEGGFAGNVLQRTFRNGSILHFSFAFLDAERTRGISCSELDVDEIQNLHIDLLSILRETMSGAIRDTTDAGVVRRWGIESYTGTPKSLDNTAHRLWEDSSQGEWVIKCHHGGCGHWNVPAISHDLMDMIGPPRDDISEKYPGIVCSKCRKFLLPRTGSWVHACPERRMEFAGRHVPQIIMPMHYADPISWNELLGKMAGANNTTPTVFKNEILGVASDEGSKMVTVTDLKAAACLSWKNKAEEAVKHVSDYQYRIIAIDWGGGGGRLRSSKDGKDERRLRTSFTVVVAMGMHGDGKIDVLWGHRSLMTHNHVYEAHLASESLVKFKASHIVHDYGGAGAIRETLVLQSGIPPQNIIPIAYHPHGHGLMNYHRPKLDHPRHWYSLARAYSLAMTCQAIKEGYLRFFEYDYVSSDQTGLLHDFLALIEEKVDSRVATDVYTIVRNPIMSDDFAQAVNYGAHALWWMHGAWPDLAAAAKMKIPADKLSHLHPISPLKWSDM